MSILATDNFNRAGPDLGANWSTDGGAETWSIGSSSFVQMQGGSNFCVYWNAVSPPNDQWAQITVTFNAGASYMGGCVRGVAGVRTSYLGTYGTTATYLVKLVAGSQTILASGAQTNVSGDLLYTEAVGTAITTKKNGVTVYSATDSALASGLAGITSNGAVGNVTGDNWSAGDFLNSRLRMLVGVGT